MIRGVSTGCTRGIGHFHVKITGLRPGGKLYEELLILLGRQDSKNPTRAQIFCYVYEYFLPWEEHAPPALND